MTQAWGSEMIRLRAGVLRTHTEWREDAGMAPHTDEESAHTAACVRLPRWAIESPTPYGQIMVRKDWPWRKYEGVYNSMIRRFHALGLAPLTDEPNEVYDHGRWRVEVYRMRTIKEDECPSTFQST